MITNTKTILIKIILSLLLPLALALAFTFTLPLKAYASTLEIQQSTIGIQCTVKAANDTDVIIPIDTYYKVTFNSAGGTIVPMQFVKQNEYATEPIAPTRANYEFKYWTEERTNGATEATGTTGATSSYKEFNFTTTPITHDITLTAVWTPTSNSTSDDNNQDEENQDEDSDHSTDDTNNDDQNEDNQGKEDHSEEDNGKEDQSEEDQGEEDQGDQDENSDQGEQGNQSNNNTPDNNNTTTDNNNDSLPSEPLDEEIDQPILDGTTPNNEHNIEHTNQTQPTIEHTDLIFDEQTQDELVESLIATMKGMFKTATKVVTTVLKISLALLIFIIIPILILLFKKGSYAKIYIQAETDSLWEEPTEWKLVHISLITKITNITKQRVEQAQNSLNTLWQLKIPDRILNQTVTNQIKIILPHKFIRDSNEQQLIIKLNNTEIIETIDQNTPTLEINLEETE